MKLLRVPGGEMRRRLGVSGSAPDPADSTVNPSPLS
jgi:hypothetical protein